MARSLSLRLHQLHSYAPLPPHQFCQPMVVVVGGKAQMWLLGAGGWVGDNPI